VSDHSEKSATGSRYWRLPKLTALVSSPLKITEVAAEVLQAAVDQAASSISDIANVSTSEVHPSAYSNGGDYYLGAEWQGVKGNNTNRINAERMATQAVDLALRYGGAHLCDAGAKRRYVQWVLAGNMAPDEAARILAVASAKPPTSIPLANLLKIIRDEAHLGRIRDETTLKATTVHVPNGSSAVAMEGFRAAAAVLVAAAHAAAAALAAAARATAAARAAAADPAAAMERLKAGLLWSFSSEERDDRSSAEGT